MTKVIKKIGMIFVWTILIGELFLIIPFMVHFTENMLNGDSVYNSANNAYETVELKIIRPIDEWFERNDAKIYWKPAFEDDLRKYEIPMSNWNIN